VIISSIQQGWFWLRRCGAVDWCLSSTAYTDENAAVWIQQDNKNGQQACKIAFLQQNWPNFIQSLWKYRSPKLACFLRDVVDLSDELGELLQWFLSKWQCHSCCHQYNSIIFVYLCSYVTCTLSLNTTCDLCEVTCFNIFSVFSKLCQH